MKRTTVVAAVVAVTLLSWPGTALAAPPDNDDFDNAIPVSGALPFTDTVSSAEATTAADDPEPCANGVVSSVWYRFTPTRSGLYVATGTAQPYGAFLSVFTGTRGALTPVVCGSNRGAWSAEAGTTYHLMVSAFPWSPPGGDFTFELDGPAVLGVTLDPSGWVDPRTGFARLSGTVTCRATHYTRVEGELLQRVGGRSVSDIFGLDAPTCDGTVRRWAAEARGPERFVSGRATVWVQVYACPDNATCLSDLVEGDVTLFNRRYGPG
ncbi:hypothetical protein C6361_06060 [Plantactinospora sp. BC1]|uniref:hypothetical protein n=1 Tax=Plantactinospora sp. BC1 TaxID=2108470 RepID=UPI000D206886|nr:hypothetical protein [Plantactinospora sp. BC1]AVT29125.1 hypothetical protein C6361_06060 [Plantactinospora sp. BC1]